MSAQFPDNALDLREAKFSDIANGSFVYFLMEEDICVYVGQTASLSDRINQHYRDSSKQFDRVLYMHVDDDARLTIELQWINSIKPKYNGSVRVPRIKEEKPPKRKKLRMGRPATGQMPQFQFRMDVRIHAKAQAQATEQGTTLSDVLRKFVALWVGE